MKRILVILTAVLTITTLYMGVKIMNTRSDSAVLQKFARNEKIIFAHRGASGSAPENTLAAIKLAKEIGANGIEIDVHLTADNQLVVIHDYEINRTARMPNGDEINPKIIVENQTLSELQKYDFGIFFGKDFAGEKIPTLKQTMDLVGADTVLDIELKANGGHPYRAAAIELAGFLYNYSKTKSIKNIFVSSFNPMALNVFKSECRRLKIFIPTALIYGTNPEVPWYLKTCQGRFIHNADILKPRYSDCIKWQDLSHFGIFKKYPIIAWTVDDPATAIALFNKNIFGIVTNHPEKIIPILK